MSAIYFIEANKLQSEPGTQLNFSGPEAKHAIQVMRIAEGSVVELGDGQGRIAQLRVQKIISNSECILELLTVEDYLQAAPELILVQALAKAGRDELAIQAATELGVSAIVPWAAERSIVKWTPDKARKNQERWQSICLEAAKQSRNPFLPLVEELKNTKQLLKLTESGLVLVLDPRADQELFETLKEWNQIVQESKRQAANQSEDNREITSEKIFLIVGPEGGIPDETVAEFIAAGAKGITLGSRILRSSTAGPTVISLLNQFFGRW